MATFNFKQGDTAPPLETRLTDSDDNRIDLSDADTVKIYVDDGDGTLIVNDTATIVDAEQGQVRYEFGDQLKAAPEDYRLEWVITYNDGREQSVPARGFQILSIEETTARNVGTATFDDPDASLTTLYVDEVGGNTVNTVPVRSNLDLDGNDVTGVGAMSTESATINGYEVEEKVGSDFSSGEDMSVAVSEDYDIYIMRFQCLFDGAGLAGLRLNGDNSSVYDSIDAGGSETNDTTEILLGKDSDGDFGVVSGTAVVFPRAIGVFTVLVDAAGRLSRLENVGNGGTYGIEDTTATRSSIDIIFSGSGFRAGTEMHIYGGNF